MHNELTVSCATLRRLIRKKSPKHPHYLAMPAVDPDSDVGMVIELLTQHRLRACSVVARLSQSEPPLRSMDRDRRDGVGPSGEKLGEELS